MVIITTATDAFIATGTVTIAIGKVAGRSQSGAIRIRYGIASWNTGIFNIITVFDTATQW